MGHVRQQRNKTLARPMGGIGGETVLPDLGMAGMLRKRVHYFTDGAVFGRKAFLNEVFAGARERFSARRRDGARRLCHKKPGFLRRIPLCRGFGWVEWGRDEQEPFKGTDKM